MRCCGACGRDWFIRAVRDKLQAALAHLPCNHFCRRYPNGDVSKYPVALEPKYAQKYGAK